MVKIRTIVDSSLDPYESPATKDSLEGAVQPKFHAFSKESAYKGLPIIHFE
jgi:hypothetical protein